MARDYYVHGKIRDAHAGIWEGNLKEGDLRQLVLEGG